MSQKYTLEFFDKYYKAHGFISLDNPDQPVLSDIASAVWSNIDIAEPSFGFVSSMDAPQEYIIFMSPKHEALLSLSYEEQANFFHNVHPLLELKSLTRMEVFTWKNKAVFPYQIWAVVWINHPDLMPKPRQKVFIPNPTDYTEEEFLRNIRNLLYIHTTITDTLLAAAVGCSKYEAREIIKPLSEAISCKKRSYTPNYRRSMPVQVSRIFNDDDTVWEMSYRTDHPFENVDIRVG